MELDSCLLEEKVRGALLPDDPDSEPTGDPAPLPGAPPTQLSVGTPGALTVRDSVCRLPLIHVGDGVFALCGPVCGGGGANLPAISSPVWLDQEQSHDLHDQPQRAQEKVSVGGAWFGVRRDPNDPRRLLSLAVKLSVRSRVPDGLILLLSDAKQMDFVVLKVAGGKLTLSADLGRGPASIASPVAVSDGHWHAVGHRVASRVHTQVPLVAS